MEISNLTNVETSTNQAFQLESLTENRIQALKSLTQLMLNELRLLENLRPRKDDFLSEEAVSLSQEVENFEIELIRLALVRAKGCQRTAARLLSTKTSTLNAKIKRYGIEPQGITIISASESQENSLVSIRSFS